MRGSGILMPVFSLPGKYGCGCFSKSARRFVDFLAEAGQKYWQILPIGPTGYGDSPYQSFSAFAGNPYFLDPDSLVDRGLLTADETGPEQLPDNCGRSADYGWLYRTRLPLLKKAWARWQETHEKSGGALEEYRRRNASWIEDYALFMALKDAHEGTPFVSWENALRFREESALAEARDRFRDQTDFHVFLQYLFEEQWEGLKSYAHSRGIRIIGDIPIYVPEDSADLWAHPELFQLKDDGSLRAVAGCPPDGFTADGQLWGNPLYEWDAHKKEQFQWWISRMRRCGKLFDVVRIDHFRGFDQYYSVPAGSPDARAGHWEDGPGIALFRAIEEQVPGLEIIAEDLGYITDSVRQLVSDTGYPNMKVLEFAFDSRDSSGRMAYLPHNYERRCVVYTGTHDNETLVGWLSHILPEELREVREYVGAENMKENDTEALAEALIRTAMASVADTCIIPLQDWLLLGEEARINMPSTTGRNWIWRVSEEMLTAELAAKIRKMTLCYGRE